MNEHQINILITRVLANEASIDEKQQLTNWINASLANKKQYEQLVSIWNNATPENNEFDADMAWQKLEQKITQRPQKIKLFWKMPMAAAVLLIFGIGFYIYYAFLGNQFTTVQTAQGETKQVNLPDGSQAWLAPLTTLAYSFDNNERTIKLDGEAFFEVVKNPQKPFVVNTQLAVTKVLGTSFNLIAYQTQKEVKLTVATGKVSFKSIKSNQENIVLASQSAEINDLGENKILSNFDINETTWSQKKLVFENQPLSKVFTTVAHLYHVKIEVNNPLIHNCHFTGQFTDATLADVMDVICKTMQLSYQKNQNIVTVTGKGCK